MTAPDVTLVLGSGGDERLRALFDGVVERREGFPQLPPLDPAEYDAMWGSAAAAVVLATSGEDLAGAYYLKVNGPGLHRHIANAGYVVDPGWRGRGVGELLVRDSIERAPRHGFDAIQFNFVFESNPARSLYERLGWREVGRIPGAVQLGDGAEDALIYWRAVP